MIVSSLNWRILFDHLIKDIQSYVIRGCDHRQERLLESLLCSLGPGKGQGQGLGPDKGQGHNMGPDKGQGLGPAGKDLVFLLISISVVCIPVS